MGKYILSRTIISDLGRMALPDEELTVEQFNLHYDHYIEQGFMRERYYQPVGNVEMSKYDSEGNLMLVSFNYEED